MHYEVITITQLNFKSAPEKVLTMFNELREKSKTPDYVYRDQFIAEIQKAGDMLSENWVEQNLPKVRRRALATSLNELKLRFLLGGIFIDQNGEKSYKQKEGYKQVVTVQLDCGNARIGESIEEIRYASIGYATSKQIKKDLAIVDKLYWIIAA